MSWVTAMFTSTLERKFVMSLTGLFLCSFLIVHLGGNLLTLVPDNGLTFNAFTHFMETNILIKVMEYVLFAGFIIHIVQAAFITYQNRQSRPVKYAVSAGSSNSKWYARNMGVLGVVILIFLVIHLKDFFYELKFGDEDFGVDANGNVNLFRETVGAFGQFPYALLYFIAMFGLGYHLWHGFQSAFRSLGLMHSKYTPAIEGLGKIYTVVITGGFMFLPVYWYLVQLLK
ncbi:MAG: succinate dehydrogenase cytochrome b subunit [Chitinophagales bacterium]|nr:succinate dehydrogenase cytochrome b subunit [Chitinophagales bacterium]